MDYYNNDNIDKAFKVKRQYKLRTYTPRYFMENWVLFHKRLEYS